MTMSRMARVMAVALVVLLYCASTTVCGATLPTLVQSHTLMKLTYRRSLSPTLVMQPSCCRQKLVQLPTAGKVRINANYPNACIILSYSVYNLNDISGFAVNTRIHSHRQAHQAMYTNEKFPTQNRKSSGGVKYPTQIAPR